MENQDSKNKKPNFQLKGPKKSDLQNNPGCSRAIFWVLSLLMIFTVISLFWSPEMKNKPNEKNLSEIVKLVRENQVKKITIENDRLVIAKLKNGEEVQATKEQSTSIVEYGLDPNKVNIDIEYKEGSAIASSILIQFVPLLIFIGLFYFLIRQTTNVNFKAMSFGQSKAKLASTSKVKFADVAGLKEAKLELEEEVEFLKNPARFKKLGAEIPKGVLLIGPPGTGKTLLAKAVAGEAGVPFFSISGSDFVEMFVGMGAARVRDMFEQAKEKAPCIVFIDEIDSVGRQRGTGLGGGHDEREQTLNQLLAEMDGFHSQKGVIIVAATNRPDVLDSALLRPGRFDRQITVDRPDLIGREAVLAVHAKSIKLATEVSLKVIAKRTPGFSGADLANVINEAALLAARHNKNFVGMEELESSIDRVLAGPERKSRIMSDVEKKTVAFHESGHTLVAALLPNTDPVHKVSIIPRGTAALGYTMQLPMEDKYLTSESEILDTLCVLLGGRAAEELILHEISTGAQNDLEKASHLARNYVCRFGMSRKLGPQTFGRQSGNIFLGHDLVQEKEYSDKTAIIIDEEVTDIIMGSYEKAKKLLNDNKGKLELLAKKLEEEEVLEGEQVLELLNIEKKRPRTHKGADIAPVEQPQQNLQFINKETDKK